MAGDHPGQAKVPCLRVQVVFGIANIKGTTRLRICGENNNPAGASSYNLPGGLDVTDPTEVACAIMGFLAYAGMIWRVKV